MRLCFVFLVVALTGCGGSTGDTGQDRSTPLDQARTALASVQSPLQRLSDALAASRPSSRTSMVKLKASAGRASEELRSSIAELTRLSDSAPVQDQHKIEGFVQALSDVRRLADELAVGKPSAAQIELTSERATEAVQDGGLDLPAFSADRLVAGLRAASKKPETKTAAATDAGGVSVPVGSAPNPSTAPSYFTYYGPAFQAKLPDGDGWGSPAQSQPTPGRLYRTSVRGPNGLFVIVDYTPYEPATFGGRYSSRTTVGQTAFGAATRYVFQGGRLPECQRDPCVDYIINGGGAGFGVLAGGPDSTASASLAQAVAESVVPSNDGE